MRIFFYQQLFQVWFGFYLDVQQINLLTVQLKKGGSIFSGVKIEMKTVFPLGHSNDVTAVVYSPGGERITSGSGDETVKEWERETGECINTFENLSGLVIQGCDFTNADLSCLSKEEKRHLKMYGAKL
ncbi:MAG: hypothetical protein JW881_18820 [Spirochaetales bacterium]|nr:hypothetical protein [Spirochaetales bacterium]